LLLMAGSEKKGTKRGERANRDALFAGAAWSGRIQKKKDGRRKKQLFADLFSRQFGVLAWAWAPGGKKEKKKISLFFRRVNRGKGRGKGLKKNRRPAVLPQPNTAKKKGKGKLGEGKKIRLVFFLRSSKSIWSKEERRRGAHGFLCRAS